MFLDAGEIVILYFPIYFKKQKQNTSHLLIQTHFKIPVNFLEGSYHPDVSFVKVTKLKRKQIYAMQCH